MRSNEEKKMKKNLMTVALSFAATFAFLTLVGTSGAGPAADSDGDNLIDGVDNCSMVPNATKQLDSDFDGQGNVCDPDPTQDGIVGVPDFGVLLGTFGLVEGAPGYNANADFTADGVVGVPDFGVLLGSFGGALTVQGRTGVDLTRMPGDPRIPAPPSVITSHP